MQWRRAGKRWVRIEPYDCRHECIQLGRWNIIKQAEWRCTLPVFTGQWLTDDVGDEYMGRSAEYGDHGMQHPEPPESHCDGCPGGWYRCDFSASVQDYERIMFESGFSSNLRLDRTEDFLVLEATNYLEVERLRHRNHWDSKRQSGS